MAEIRFYHLSRGGVMTALPQLLSKGLQTGRRIVVRTSDSKAAEKIAADLWTYDADSFIPHGSAADGHAADQPVWITPDTDTPNGATMLLSLRADGHGDTTDGFDLICDLFDGNNAEETAAARARWAALKTGPHTLTYWQQTDTGWEKKA